jgi:hypothetical protein
VTTAHPPANFFAHGLPREPAIADPSFIDFFCPEGCGQCHCGQHQQADTNSFH